MTCQPRAVRRCARSSALSVTSTVITPVPLMAAAVEVERISRPPSTTTTWSLTLSSSPSRWEVTSTEMPKSVPIRLIRPSISSRPAGSRPLVGSSSMTSSDVHQCLCQLDPLTHPRRVAADLAVALLIEPHMTQRVCCPLAGHGRGESGHAAEVDHALGGRHVRREAVVLRHVADPATDLLAVARDVQPKDLRCPGARREQTEQNLDQRRLPGPVGSDQTSDAWATVRVSPSSAVTLG